jgi:group II intron reverse transcriptase/maturase
MNERGKSDSLIVPGKLPNKGCGALRPAEGVEGRGLAEGNLFQQTRSRTQSRRDLQHALGRIRQAARKDKKLRFTALWHHVYNEERLRKAYFSLKRKAAPGVDGETWQHYGQNLEENLRDLSERLQRGAYRAKPVKRTYIPKADGRQRPIGVTTLEDKIVQRAVTEVLGAIYETDFKGFSYGFRPGRSAHDALDALAVGIRWKKVSWVLDADIRGFFDAIDHEWLVKFVEHRIADRRVIRHIRKWLKAGVMEEGKQLPTEEGTPQGGSISPLLANIYLHYVLDLWAAQWRRKQAEGDVIIVRYADDVVFGFQYRWEAERFLADLRERLRKFNLELHEDKTRLIEFGRFAAKNRKRRGEGKPESFNFLGFTHICGRDRNGKFVVLRHTMRERLRAKLRAIRKELKQRLHMPIPVIARWLRSVLRGHYNYYGVPRNGRALNALRFYVGRLWFKCFYRRSQRTRSNWERLNRLIKRWLPYPKIRHPYPEQRLRVFTQGRSPVR